MVWERSSVWLERMPVTHEVASSSLVVPAIKRSHLVWLFFNGRIDSGENRLCEFGGFWQVRRPNEVRVYIIFYCLMGE